MARVFPWKRFWCGRTGSFSLNDNGFLIDPESEHAKYSHIDVKSFDEIQNIPCLILLGEPGSGKTTALEEEYQNLADNIDPQKELLFYKNLNEYGDESRLINEIFKSSVFEQWGKNQVSLNLFLDSLDECLLDIPKLTVIFRNQFKKFIPNIDRLNLRISCRTGEWPETLTDFFTLLWGKKNVAAYELTPLRKKDVEKAAKLSELDSSVFVSTIIKKEVQPIAIYPITLKFLIDEFKNKDQFPDNRYELFLKGCERLCTENNPDRNSRQRKDSISPTKRLTLASRAAAVMVFCNRSSIITQSNLSNIDETALPLSKLMEGDETTGDYTFSFTENDVKETITQTAIFTSRGPYRFGFSHQTFMEFLAARYLALHQLSMPQINSLIFISSDPDKMIIPQLKETVVWLNTMIPEMIKETIQTDPQSILSGDISSLESQFRKNLVASLLSQFEKIQIIDTDWGHYAQYHKLKHPELASQLESYIKDRSKHFLVRRVAIDIAEACEEKELQNLLVEVALDKKDSIHIRDQASHAIYKIADPDVRKRLKPLALKSIQEDKDDQLKGNALRALWPNYLSAKEVFENLTPPKQEMFFGSYYLFLSEMTKELKLEALPHALKWVKNNPGDRASEANRYHKLADKILLHAWNHHLDKQKIMNAYVDAVIPRIENYKTISPSLQNLEDEQQVKILLDPVRKNLIKTIVHKIKNYRNFLFSSSLETRQLLSKNDLKWLVEELKSENNNKKKKIWVEIIYDIYQRDIANHTNLILAEMSKCKLLADRFQNIFKTIDLDSEKANKFRQRHEKILKWEKEQKREETEKKKGITPSAYERIRSCIEKFENGDFNAWWQICLEMTVKEGDRDHFWNFSDPDLTEQSGWKVCDDFLKERILNAAKKYILETGPSTDKWLGKNVFHHPSMGGYKAFVLLQKFDSSFLENLPTDIWKKWAPVFIDYPGSNDTNGVNPYAEMLKKAYRKAPQKIISSLLVLINKENESHGHVYIIRKFDGFLDAKLQKTLFDKMQDKSLKPACSQEILSLLIKSGDPTATEYAKTQLKLPIRKNEAIQEKAVAAALSLLCQAEDAGWENVFPALKTNKTFGKKVLVSLPDFLRYQEAKSFDERIEPKKIAEFFILLSTYFPKEEDRFKDGGFVEEGESIARFRNNLLKTLEDIGTIDSIQALEYINKKLPQLDIIDYHLIHARRNLRRNSWSPLTPEEFLFLTKNSDSRIIHDSGNLVDVLLESLERLEKKLQGETPNAVFLWDSLPPGKKSRPKPEDRLSDFIKTHFSEDLKGIIPFREVEIRHPKKNECGKSGEKTDIYVAYFAPSTQKIAKCIIEVKGCWHDEVLTAMESQLLNRYMDESGIDYGIYLVGWYCCPHWDKIKNKTSASNIVDAQKLFNEQAKTLSTDTKKIKACVLNCALR